MEKILKSLVARPAWVAVFAFLICGLREIGLPGLYLDAVNPDYLAAHALHPLLDNPRYLLPGSSGLHMFLAGSFYHGAQNFYVSWLVQCFWGTSVASIRLAQMLFGCLVVGSCTALVGRLTNSKAWAILCGLGLATDIAFIASFRNQNYIVLGGFAWLSLSVLLLFPRDSAPIGSRRAFASGVFSGLAAYGYFVLLFFYPAVLGMLLAKARSRCRGAFAWFAGVVIGLVPYICGYAAMYKSLGGFTQWKAYLVEGITGLHPTGAASDLVDRTKAVLHFAQYALSNAEGALMAFRHPLPSIWGDAKPYLFALIIGALLFLSLMAKLRGQSNVVAAQLAWLPVSFVAVAAAVFGARLGAHHFSVMTPLFYVLLAVLFATLVEWHPVGKRHDQRLALAMVVLVVAMNLLQQQPYMNELDRTGGVGSSSSALTTMAEDASENGGGAIYAFPDWGFFTSFALLTENRVPYLIDADPAAMANAVKRYPDREQIRLAFWNKNDADKYRVAMNAAGLMDIVERDYRQRDGQVAFYMLEGRVHGSPASGRIR